MEREFRWTSQKPTTAEQELRYRNSGPNRLCHSETAGEEAGTNEEPTEFEAETRRNMQELQGTQRRLHEMKGKQRRTGTEPGVK